MPNFHDGPRIRGAKKELEEGKNGEVGERVRK